MTKIRIRGLAEEMMPISFQARTFTDVGQFGCGTVVLTMFIFIISLDYVTKMTFRQMLGYVWNETMAYP